MLNLLLPLWSRTFEAVLFKYSVMCYYCITWLSLSSLLLSVLYIALVVYMYVYLYVCIYVCVWMYLCISVCIYVWKYLLIYVCMCACIFVLQCKDVCMHVCTSSIVAFLSLPFTLTLFSMIKCSLLRDSRDVSKHLWHVPVGAPYSSTVCMSMLFSLRGVNGQGVER